MTLDNPKSKAAAFNEVSKAVLLMIMLFIGLNVFTTLSLFALPYITDSELRLFFLRNINLASNGIFGIIILILAKDLKARIPIFILSILSPLCGIIFYLISIALIQIEND